MSRSGKASNVHVGNAEHEGASRRGWFVGHFIEGSEDLRSTDALEIKWWTHPAGDEKSEWTASVAATNLCLLLRGTFVIRLPERDVVLSRPGDYVIWGPGIAHRWTSREDSTILAARWPSRPGDIVSVRRQRDGAGQPPGSEERARSEDDG